ncbi:hypothetical protein [Actinophytocola sp. KF-1]
MSHVAPPAAGCSWTSAASRPRRPPGHRGGVRAPLLGLHRDESAHFVRLAQAEEYADLVSRVAAARG